VLVGVVPEPPRQVEEAEETERICTCRRRIAATVQLSVPLQFSQRVVLRFVRSSSSTDAASCHLPGLLLAADGRTAYFRPVSRTVGRPIGVHGRVRASVVRDPVRRWTRQLLLDGSGRRTRVLAVEHRTGSPLPGRSHPASDGAATAPARVLLRSGRLGIARTQRM